VREASAEAKAFYERCGFEPPGEVVYRIEDEGLRLLAESGRAEADETARTG
jgi:hypothetical protein